MHYQGKVKLFTGEFFALSGHCTSAVYSREEESESIRSTESKVGVPESSNAHMPTVYFFLCLTAI